MNSSRAFFLLLWLGLGGLTLLVAAVINLVLGVLPADSTLHQARDGVCAFVPLHGDFLFHALSYSAAFLLLGVLGLSVQYAGRQAMAFRSLTKTITDVAPSGRDERLLQIIRRAGISTSVLLIDSPRRMAFTAGLRRPRIFVTTGLAEVLTEKQLEAVLLHEEYHAVRRDPLRTALARALATMLFFLPILKEFANHFCVGKEVDADLAAIRQQRTRLHVASALYKIGGSNDSSLAGTVAFGEAASVEARIEALRTGRWRGRAFSASALKWSVVGVLLMITLVFHPLTGLYDGWATAFSLAACPLWLVLYWANCSRTA